MAFNKEGQPNIVEITKTTKILPSNFPIREFLEKYNTWKNTPINNQYNTAESIYNRDNDRQGLFADLRDFHQKHGVNSKSTIFGSEEEMHAFAKFVTTIGDNRAQTKIHIGTVVPTNNVTTTPIIQTQVTATDRPPLGTSATDKYYSELQEIFQYNNEQIVAFEKKVNNEGIHYPHLIQIIQNFKKAYASSSSQGIEKSIKITKDLQVIFGFQGNNINGKFDPKTQDRLLQGSPGPTIVNALPNLNLSNDYIETEDPKSKDQVYQAKESATLYVLESGKINEEMNIKEGGKCVLTGKIITIQSIQYFECKGPDTQDTPGYILLSKFNKIYTSQAKQETPIEIGSVPVALDKTSAPLYLEEFLQKNTENLKNMGVRIERDSDGFNMKMFLDRTNFDITIYDENGKEDYVNKPISINMQNALQQYSIIEKGSGVKILTIVLGGGRTVIQSVQK